jgi:CubicO group peptidase (beta-lactamase class C family)
MSELERELDSLATENDFSGVVRVDRGGEIELSKAYGMAHRALEVPNRVETRLALASGTKGPTALVVVSLIEEGVLGLETTARSLLESDLPLIDDGVTVEQLLSHRSGIGDYLDEDGDYEMEDYLMPIPVHRLATPEDYLAVLDGFPQKFASGTQFSYCNGGFVVLALIAERASGRSYHDLVQHRVFDPAGMSGAAFLRSDELPGNAAVGYLDIEGAARSNVLHMPLRGVGDGGIYANVADISVFWSAFFAGRIVSEEWVAEMVRPRSDAPSESMRYGLGFWLHESTDSVILIGADAGVSFRTVHDPGSDITHTAISNSSYGVWPITEFLDKTLGL